MSVEQENIKDLTKENTSDEDTEDASEPEMAKLDEENGKSGSVDEKLLLLRGQLKKLKEGIDPDYLSLVEEADRVREKRVFVAQVFREYELAAAQEERDKERESAFQQFESKKMELKECLLHDLQDKKKAYDNYRHNVDLGSAIDSFEPKTMVTRKLRRRHNLDPLPPAEKRRKPTPHSSLVYVLEESEVDEDMKLIFKGKVLTSSGKTPLPVPVCSSDGGIVYEARIEDGKLFYENRWFHKGQHVFVESREHGQESGIITSISQSEIWVRRLPDNSKLRIYLSHLTRGRYVLKRRSA